MIRSASTSSSYPVFVAGAGSVERGRLLAFEPRREVREDLARGLVRLAAAAFSLLSAVLAPLARFALNSGLARPNGARRSSSQAGDGAGALWLA